MRPLRRRAYQGALAILVLSVLLWPAPPVGAAPVLPGVPGAPGAVSPSPPTLAGPRANPLAPSGGTVPVNLLFSPSTIQLSPEFWGTTISADSRLLPNEADLLNATGVHALVYPGADAGDRLDVLNDTLLRIHKGALTWTPPLTNLTQFIALCRAISCEAILQVPGEIDSPSFAASVVTYVETTLGFHPAYWEVGNEPELWKHWDQPWNQWNTPDQKGAAVITPGEYAWELHNYTTAMRAVDPSLRILDLAGTGRAQHKIPLSDWINTTVQVDGSSLSGVAFHVYTAGTKGNVTPEQFFAFDTGPYSVPGRVSNARSAISNEINATCPSCADPPVFLTEFGSALSHYNFATLSRTFAGGLSLAASATQAMDLNATNLDLFASVLNTSNSWFAPDGVERPDYTVYAQFLSHLGPSVEPVTLQTPSSPIYTVGNTSLSANLYGVASRDWADQGRSDLLLINQNTSTNVSLTPALPGIPAGTPAEAWTWGGQIDYAAANRSYWEEPTTPAPVATYFPSGLPSSWQLAPQTIALFEAFPSSSDQVTFQASGLPSGARWFLHVGANEVESASQNLTVLLPAGTQPISPVPLALPIGKLKSNPEERLMSFPPSSILVSNVPLVVPVPFFDQFHVGLTIYPTGTGTVVPLYPWANESVPYLLVATPRSGYVVDRWWGIGHGSYKGGGAIATIVARSPIEENVTFARGFNATFEELGLPVDTGWSVTFNGVPEISSSSSITFGEMNGSYDYVVKSLHGYTASPARAVVSLRGQAVTVRIDFVPIPELFPVHFEEVGLPGGVPWAVSVEGSLFTSSGAWTSMSLLNGSYSFWVENADGYHPTLAGGLLDVRGAGLIEPVEFVPFLYPLTVDAPGLPAGVAWGIHLAGSTTNSTAASLALDEPNGSYAWTAETPAGYSAQPARGEIVVNGTRATLQIDFRTLPSSPSFGVQPFDGTVVIVVATVGLLGLMSIFPLKPRKRAPISAPRAGADPGPLPSHPVRTFGPPSPPIPVGRPAPPAGRGPPPSSGGSRRPPTPPYTPS